MKFDQMMKQPTWVRFSHTANLKKPFDVYIDDHLVCKDLQVNEMTDIIPISKGIHTVKIYVPQTKQLLCNEPIDIAHNQIVLLTNPDHTNKIKLKMVDSFNKDKVTNYMMYGVPDSGDFLLSEFRNNPRENTMIKKVLDQYDNVLDVLVDQFGVVLENVENNLGAVVIRTGDQIKRIIDQSGEVVEVIVNQSGKIVARVFGEFGSIIQSLASRIGNSIKHVTDQFGNLVDVVVDQFENIVGWVIDEVGDTIEEAIDDFSELTQYIIPDEEVEPLMAPPISIPPSDDERHVVQLTPTTSNVDITLPDGTKVYIRTK
jgi:hypothetical protein